MNQKKAKELLPIITAFAEGKTIEMRTDFGDWEARKWFRFDLETNRYRIKPEPRYEPYTPDQLAALVGKPLKHEETGTVFLVSAYYKRDNVVSTCKTRYNSAGLLEYFTHLDGTPCGNLVV